MLSPVDLLLVLEPLNAVDGVLLQVVPDKQGKKPNLKIVIIWPLNIRPAPTLPASEDDFVSLGDGGGSLDFVHLQ